MREHLNEDCSAYSDLLGKAVLSIDPVFFRPEYSQFFWHCASTIPGWVQRVLVACTKSESRGSLGLLDLWKATTICEEAEVGLLRHAKDEARHSRMFLRMLRLTYPGFLASSTMEETQRALAVIRRDDEVKSGANVSEEDLIDQFVQLNITEIRTRIHLGFLAPIYFESTTDDKKSEVGELLQRLGRDEIVHIAYTAKLLNEWARGRDLKSLAASSPRGCKRTTPIQSNTLTTPYIVSARVAFRRCSNSNGNDIDDNFVAGSSTKFRRVVP